MSIYVSTGAFKTKDINRILDIAYKNNITNIELAPGLEYNRDIEGIIYKAKNDFNFLIHNYFPTPKEEFALNLASLDKEIHSKSMDLCLHAIDICNELNIPYYSVHCGFCFDTNGSALGNSSQLSLDRVTKKDAEEKFISSIGELCKYAYKKKIGVAIENNVLAGFAKGEKNLLLGVDDTEIVDMIKSVNMENLSFLVDLAHAKVSSNSYGFEMNNFIQKTVDYVKEVHVSENDGSSDQNLKVRPKSDVYKWLSHYRNKTITIEVYNLDINEIKSQIRVIENAINSI